MRLSDFRVLTFDVYGTLIDWESGMIEGLRPLTARVGRTLSRDDILSAHARHESLQQAWTPGKRYRDLLPIVHKRLAEEWGVVASHEECVAYGRSVNDWPAFADSVESLRYLKKHYKLAVLTNTDNESFAASDARLGVTFDAAWTAEDIGSYKPADRNFEYMLEKLETMGLGKTDVLHTAESLFHDHTPANRHGLTSCWIFRRHGQEGSGATMPMDKIPDYAFRFNSMADMIKAHQEEQAGA